MRFKAARDFMKTNNGHAIMEYERSKKMTIEQAISELKELDYYNWLSSNSENDCADYFKKDKAILIAIRSLEAWKSIRAEIVKMSDTVYNYEDHSCTYTSWTGMKAKILELIDRGISV